MNDADTLLLIVSLLLALPIAGSLIVWVRVLIAWPRRTPLFDHRIDPLPKEKRLYLFFAGSFIAIAQTLIVPGIAAQLITPTQVDATGKEIHAAETEYRNQLRISKLQCGQEVMVFCIGLMVVLAMPKAERDAAGFHPHHPGEQVRSGLVGFLAALLPVYLLVLATLPMRSEDTQHGLLKILSADGGQELKIWVTIQAILLAPLAEEMMYRVLLQGGLIQAGYSPGMSIAAVAVFFCISHNPVDSLPLLPLAFILGWVYYLRNSFLACVLIHILFNGFNVAATILGTMFN